MNLNDSKQSSANNKNPFFFLGLLVILLFSNACESLNGHFRDYSEKPFNTEEWKKGDAIERGRMISDIFAKQILTGKSKEDIEKLLGKPIRIQRVERREVWLYYVEHSHQLPQKYFPVSFEKNGKTFAGRIKNGTISILVEN